MYPRNSDKVFANIQKNLTQLKGSVKKLSEKLRVSIIECEFKQNQNSSLTILCDTDHCCEYVYIYEWLQGALIFGYCSRK